VLLLGFVACIGVAVVVSGMRSGPGQGIAPTVAAFTGYLSALLAAVLLIVPAAGHPDGTRTIGLIVLVALVVLVLADLYAAEGPNIGAGFLQLLGEVVILVAAVRLALGISRAGRTG
jgi:hypothetical protein